jgi:hypothetical protein
MRISIIPADQMVIIDGAPVFLDPWPGGAEGIHAIQWQETYGQVEPALGAQYRIDALGPYRDIVDAALAAIGARPEA